MVRGGRYSSRGGRGGGSSYYRGHQGGYDSYRQNNGNRYSGSSNYDNSYDSRPSRYQGPNDRYNSNRPTSHKRSYVRFNTFLPFWPLILGGKGSV